jgi:hypothetical protein
MKRYRNEPPWVKWVAASAVVVAFVTYFATNNMILALAGGLGLLVVSVIVKS